MAHDALGPDYVIMVTNPAAIDGGEFHYFHGTRHEARAYRERDEPIPEERIGTPAFLGRGYAVLQQGTMEVHRAAPLRSLGERITLVNGYLFADARCADPTDFEQLRLVDPKPTISVKSLRHRAPLQLQQVVEGTTLEVDPASLSTEIRRTIAELEAAVHQIERGKLATMRHYGD